MKPVLQPLSEVFIYASPEQRSQACCQRRQAAPVARKQAAGSARQSDGQMDLPKRAKKYAEIDFKDPGFIRELLLTLVAAVWTGFAGSVVLILLVFMLAAPGQTPP